jgi:hypothetical protein
MKMSIRLAVCFVLLYVTTLNGVALNGSYPQITVNQGADITGSFRVGVQNDYPGSAITPLAATTTWGNPSTSYWGLDPWVDTGYSIHSVNVSSTAPVINGTYYLAVVMEGVYNYDQMMSGTHPGWSAVWGTGCEIALQPGTTFEHAIVYGQGTVPWWRPDLGQIIEWWDAPMTAVRIDVVPEPTTMMLFGLGSLALLRKRRA